MKILIKGAGDLATGIACRLKNSGYDILMTEIAEPTTVRRTVAFSRVVYERECEIEGIQGVLVEAAEQINRIQLAGKVAVMIDEKAEIIEKYQPDILVDAILAKKNMGTKIEDAPLVIGVGPGFTAGNDVHVVIETKRGHYLGRVIREGSAIPNTGMPGDVGGFTTERLLRASAAGLFRPIAAIGDIVQNGQKVAEVIVAETADKESVHIPIYAQMTGIVRGMLQDGIMVIENMKVGDIDARCEKEHCYSISDKARAIGGGVLEAVVAFEHGRVVQCIQ